MEDRTMGLGILFGIVWVYWFVTSATGENSNE